MHTHCHGGKPEEVVAGMECDIKVVVMGQPNVGKSTLFNVLTGESARVSNWPGTTVEIKYGSMEFRGRRVCFVDLPGIYGLGAVSLDEMIAKKYLISGDYDVVLVLVDATAPERTIYLALQVLELTGRVVIALTKSDLAHTYGIHIHVDKLESKLGVPVVAVSAVKGSGLRELIEALIKVATGSRGEGKPLRVEYGSLEPFISDLIRFLRGVRLSREVDLRWLAIRLLEGDEDLFDILGSESRKEVMRKVKVLRREVSRLVGKSLEELIISARFSKASAILSDVVVREEIEVGERVLDRVFRTPFLGALASLGVIFSVFFIAFAINLGFPLNYIALALGRPDVAALIEEYSLSSLIELVFTEVGEYLKSQLAFNPQIASLVADGAVAGVGAVLTFFPLIAVVSAFNAVLEDTGLAPRIAVALHNTLQKFGLSGKSAYPIFVALGCNVPAIMGSRVAIEEEERLQMAISLPFIPCQARLLVLLFFVNAVSKDPAVQALIVASIYAIGLATFLITSKVIRSIFFKVKRPPELLIEVPPLHPPNWKVVWWTTWDLSKHFLRKAGIIIFVLSLVTWGLLTLGPEGVVDDPSRSYAASLGKLLSPVLSTLYGIEPETSWKLGFALINGFVAKEGLISAMAVLEGVSEAEVFETLALSFPQGYAIIVFLMLYIPCLATVAVIKQEVGSWKLTALSVINMLVVATLASVIAYWLAVLAVALSS